MVLAGGLGAAALVVVYWALGGTWGLVAMTDDPEPFQPPASLMWISALLLGGWVMIALGAAGTWGGDRAHRFCRWACCVIALALLGIGASFQESQVSWARMIVAPLVLLLSVAATLLVFGETPTRRRLFPW
jgi:hypothetical protein